MFSGTKCLHECGKSIGNDILGISIRETHSTRICI
jgi:hypothetical protein